MAFGEHGELKTEWIENVLLVSPCGSINIEAAKSFNEQIKSAYAQFSTSGSGVWFRIGFFMTHDTLFTPGVVNHLIDSLSFSQRNDCQHLFVVGGNLCAREIASKCGNEVGLPCQRFDTLEQFYQYLSGSESLLGSDLSSRIIERLTSMASE